MDHGVFDEYPVDQYPQLHEKLESAWSRIQPVREGAAFKALADGRCDRVELSEVSGDRSTPDNISVFVDCTNQERFYFSEADLDRGPVVAQSDLTVDRGAAIRACAGAARAEAMFPSLVDTHTWAGASFQANKTTGNARVLLNFEATNAMGVELPHMADCLFPDAGGAIELNITSR